MLKKERQAYILQQINIHNKVLSTDLCTQLNVSEDTVRRDLQELAEEGKLVKVHGGALSTSYHISFNNTNIYSLPEKQRIAHKTLPLIKDGMVILLSGGTTIRELIKSLPENLSATFITVSVSSALELLDHPNCEVIFIGNKLNKSAQISVGAEVIEKLKYIKADLCILGTNSIHPTEGITDLEWEIIEVKKAMIQASTKVASLAISEKLNSVQKYKVCPTSAIHYLITELEPSATQLSTYVQTGVQVL